MRLRIRSCLGRQTSKRSGTPRHEASYPIGIEVQLYGYHRKRRHRRPDTNQRLDTSGVTINLSRGGMLARVERTIPVNTNCLIHFRGAEGLIAPEYRWGVVIQSVAVQGDCELSVKFASPLERLVQRRAHPRYEHHYRVLLEVEQPGSEPAMGTTSNISRGGMLLDVDQSIAPGKRCLVRFRGASGQVSPESTSATVRRAEPRRETSYPVALEFDRVLDVLKEPARSRLS